MLTSLDDAALEESLTADVVIIGAGLVGLVLADKLLQFGMSVVVLESGDKKQEQLNHPLNEVIMTSDLYNGATEGRFRCLGGTSTRWGGAMLPFLDEDFGPHPAGWHNGWPVNQGDVGPFLKDVECIFGLTVGSYEGLPTKDNALASFLERSPKWPKFSKRSTSRLFGRVIRNSKSLHVITNATVTQILHINGCIKGVIAKSVSHKQIRVEAPRAVIAAGAIETTRILLMLFRDNPIANGGHFLGFGLHDHISAPIAKFDVKDFNSMVRAFGFKFCNGGMRNKRFELNPQIREKLGLPGGFLHVTFSRADGTAFDGLRKIYQSIQRNELPKMRDCFSLVSDLPWFFNAAWWRFVEKRVLPPNGSSFELHLVIEQAPKSENRLMLSKSHFDDFGQPLLEIDWRIGNDDSKNFMKIANLSIRDWNSGSYREIAHANALSTKYVCNRLKTGGGAFHPAGTTRIAKNYSDGVLDPNLRVFGFDGLWAISTAMFPSVGSGNPSLALLQFCLRASHNIHNSMSKIKRFKNAN